MIHTFLQLLRCSIFRPLLKSRKRARTVLSVISILLFSHVPLSYASFISNNDISALTFTQPDQWQTLNAIQLFDGINDRYTATRFAAYQNSGDDLSADNTFNISVALISGANVSSISFYNDWRHHLRQQVAAMNVALYGENSRLLWANTFTDLQQNTWDQIDLVSFAEPVLNVTKIEFNITREQGNHFEIREFLVGVQDDQQFAAVNANSPSIFVLFGLMIAGLLWRIKR